MQKYNKTLITLLAGAKAVNINQAAQSQLLSQIEADDFGKWVENAINDVTDFWGGVVEDVTDWVEDAVEDTVDWVEGAIEDTSEWFEDAGEDIADWAEETGEWFD